MKLFLSIGQYRVIDNFPGQGMFEDIGGMRIDAPFIEKL